MPFRYLALYFVWIIGLIGIGAVIEALSSPVIRGRRVAVEMNAASGFAKKLIQEAPASWMNAL
jgi:uncharacterized membrane protein